MCVYIYTGDAEIALMAAFKRLLNQANFKLSNKTVLNSFTNSTLCDSG